jgi:hypothetical protein
MGTTAYWRLTRSGESLSDETKYILRKAFNDPLSVTLYAHDAEPVLRAIAAASRVTEVQQDVAAMLEALEKYGEIEVSERS